MAHCIFLLILPESVEPLDWDRRWDCLFLFRFSTGDSGFSEVVPALNSMVASYYRTRLLYPPGEDQEAHCNNNKKIDDLVGFDITNIIYYGIVLGVLFCGVI
jgi:hypothetical protein